MSEETSAIHSVKMESAIQEMKQIILQHIPEATFDIGPGEDSVGMYLIATVDLEDLGEVMDLYRDGLVDLQVEEGLPLYVISARPIQRTLEMSRKERKRTPWLQGA